MAGEGDLLRLLRAQCARTGSSPRNAASSVSFPGSRGVVASFSRFSPY